MREVWNGLAHAAAAAAIVSLGAGAMIAAWWASAGFGFIAGGIIGVLAELKESSPRVLQADTSSISWFDVLGYALGGAVTALAWNSI